MNLTETAIQLEALRRTNHRADRFPAEAGTDSPPRISNPEYEEILQKLVPAPTGTALLGLCQDGLPLLLDLASNSPGGLLLLDPQPDRIRALLTGIIASVIHLSPPESIEIFLISPQLDQFPHPPEGAYVFRWADMRKKGAQELLYEFLSAAGNQEFTLPDNRLRLLLLDEAHQFLPILDRYTQDLLGWAATNGPQSGCRVVASALAVESGTLLPEAFLASFDVRVYGHPPDSRSSRLAPAPQIDPATHTREGYFSINIAGESTPFWLPSNTASNGNF
jgi:hypothetical protein